LFAFFLQGRQGGLQDVRRGGAIAPGAAPVEIGRRAVQAHHERGALNGAGRLSVILGRERGGVEFFLGRAFPQELQIQFLGGSGGLGQQRGGRGLGESEQRIAPLD